MRKPEAIRHVLFDNDGTIVDSEIIAARAMIRMLAEHGLHIAERDYNMRFPGLLTRDIVALLEKEEGFIAPPNFIELLHRQHNDAFRSSLRAIKGMTGIFRGLKSPKSMVSNGSVRHVEQCLRKVRLLSAVDGMIFSAEQVRAPKPAPDVYLHALDTLRLQPHEVLVVEDSPTGVRAAAAAGITTIGFLGAAHIHDGHEVHLLEAGASHIAVDAQQLAGIFRAHGVL